VLSAFEEIQTRMIRRDATVLDNRIPERVGHPELEEAELAETSEADVVIERTRARD
jgi:hypothetical protein